MPSTAKSREYDYSFAKCIGKIERQGWSETKAGERKWRIKYKNGKKPCGWEDGQLAKPKVIQPLVSGTVADEPKKHTPVKTDHRTYLIDWHDGN